MDRQKSGDRNRSPATNNGPDSLGMQDALPQREGGRRKQEKSKVINNHLVDALGGGMKKLSFVLDCYYLSL